MVGERGGRRSRGRGCSNRFDDAFSSLLLLRPSYPPRPLGLDLGSRRVAAPLSRWERSDLAHCATSSEAFRKLEKIQMPFSKLCVWGGVHRPRGRRGLDEEKKKLSRRLLSLSLSLSSHRLLFFSKLLFSVSPRCSFSPSASSFSFRFCSLETKMVRLEALAPVSRQRALSSERKNKDCVRQRECVKRRAGQICSLARFLFFFFSQKKTAASSRFALELLLSTLPSPPADHQHQRDETPIAR